MKLTEKLTPSFIVRVQGLNLCANVLWDWMRTRLDNTFQRCLVSQFPYAPIYTVENQTLLITSVMNLHRKPNYIDLMRSFFPQKFFAIHPRGVLPSVGTSPLLRSMRSFAVQNLSRSPANADQKPD
jgi:hypothetical protein